MALAKNVNQLFGVGTTGASWVWLLIVTLVAGGWTVTADSDGTTYNATGGQVTSGASGAHGLGNTDAWVRLSNPAGTFFLTIQRGANSLVWRVKVAQVSFVLGSPGATQTPSATNEAIVLGGGTDASPSFVQWIGQGDAGGYRGQFVAESTAPYRVLAFAYDPASGTNIHTKFILDFITAFLAAGDTFPWAVHCAGGGSGADTMNDTPLMDPTSSQAAPWTWLGNPGTGTFKRVPTSETLGDGAASVAPDGGAVNAITGAWDLKPLAYERRSGDAAPKGFKGHSSMLFWRPASTHATGDLYNVASTGDAALLNQVVCSLWTGDALTGAVSGTNRGAARLLTPSSGDTTPPVVSNVSPTPGTRLNPGDAVSFDVTDDVGLRRVKVIAKFPFQWDAVHDGSNFSPMYSAASTRTAIAGGFHYSIVRNAGWTQAPVIDVDAIDTSGNEN